MGAVAQVNAASVSEVLSRLNVIHCGEYRAEFAQSLSSDPALLVEDWSTEAELLEVFYCYVRATRPRTIVELGTYKGTAAIVFGAAVTKNSVGRVVTIDNNRCGTIAQARERFSTRGLDSAITLLESSSNSAFIRWKRVPIDFLYIDASHTYLHACCDFALWARAMSANGLIAMHDTVFHLERKFPEDYIHPLQHYDVLNVIQMQERPSGQDWKGCGFISAAACCQHE